MNLNGPIMVLHIQGNVFYFLLKIHFYELTMIPNAATPYSKSVLSVLEITLSVSEHSGFIIV